MARSIEPVAADPERRLSEPVVVQPEISRPVPVPGSAWTGPAASLSHGTAVEASILARLLGIPLLRLDAHIDMVPIDGDPVVGRVQRYSTAPMIELSALSVSSGTSAASSGTLADAAQLLEHASRALGDVRRERVARYR
jgi:hypothetical protein